MENYFLHRIQKENGSFNKGIEVHDNLDDAIRSFWGRMKTAYSNPQNPGMTFVSCKITDASGGIIYPYNLTWMKNLSSEENTYFLHHIRKSDDTFTKSIDTYNSQDQAMVAFATAMEYGYNNPRFPNVSLVSCEITDLLSGGMVLISETWQKPEDEPEAEPEVESD